MKRLRAPALPPWIESMLPDEPSRYCVDVGGYRMHVMEWGQGRPVLMLHGNPTWGFLYRRVVSELLDEPLRLITPDLIGLGYSDKPRDAAAHQLADHAAWMRSLIEQLDLKDLIFVGQDWGGPVGLIALADMPERLAGLVVLNTVVGPPRQGFKPTAFHALSQMPIVSDILFRNPLAMWALPLVQGNKRSIAGKVARAYREPLRRLRDNIALLALARMAPNNFEHPSVVPLTRSQELVAGFDGPAAIVWGDRDPILGRVRSRIERLLPQAEVTRTQAGHFLQEEVPIEIASAIVAVAEELQRSAAA